MTETNQLEALRRAVELDPGSIAFAQLAEEHRRAGRRQEAVDCCRAGLAAMPGYVSLRITLGRALVQIGQVDEGQRELEAALAEAPGNLTAIRALDELHERRRERRAGSHAAPEAESALGDGATSLGLGSQPSPHRTLSTPDDAAAVLVATSAAHAPGPRPGNALASIPDADLVRALRTIVALEGWLDALHVVRANRVA